MRGCGVGGCAGAASSGVMSGATSDASSSVSYGSSGASEGAGWARAGLATASTTGRKTARNGDASLDIRVLGSWRGGRTDLHPGLVHRRGQFSSTPTTPPIASGLFDDG